MRASGVFFGLLVIGLVVASPTNARQASWTLPDGAPAQTATAATTSRSAPPPTAAELQDSSEEVLLADRTLADQIFDNGPLAAYSAWMSPIGQLFDSAGSAPPGIEGVQSRFGSFPNEVRLDRRPDKAVASGSAGSSWGTFAVRRGDQILTQGYYLTSWRREQGEWRIVMELAAGRAIQSPPPPRPGASTDAALQPAANPALDPVAETEQVLRDAFGRPVRP